MYSVLVTGVFLLCVVVIMSSSPCTAVKRRTLRLSLQEGARYLDTCIPLIHCKHPSIIHLITNSVCRDSIIV